MQLFVAAETSDSSASLIAPYPSNVSVSAGQKAIFRCTVSVSGSSSSSSSHLPRVQVNDVQTPFTRRCSYDFGTGKKSKSIRMTHFQKTGVPVSGACVIGIRPAIWKSIHWNAKCTLRVYSFEFFSIFERISHRTIVGQSCRNRRRLFSADSLSDGMTLSTDHFQAELDTIFRHG